MAGQPPGSSRSLPVLALAAGVALGSACGGTHQRPDEEFQSASRALRADAVKASGTNVRPTRILFDHAHYNFHRIDGRYKPFAELVTSAGFEIRATSRRFEKGTIGNADILVIANATPEPGGQDGDTFLDAELDAVQDFVERGGGLLLITDMPPWATPATRLAARFGVRVSGGIVFDRAMMNPALPNAQNLLFTREDGTLGRHPILDGHTPAERVDAIATFSGQALFAPGDAVPLLRFAPTAVHIPFDTTYVLSRYGTDVVTTKGRPQRFGPTEGAAQAVALERGKGRVVVMGEAAALTAQVVSDNVRFGMNLPGADNAKFALNTLKWLSGR